MEERSQEHTIDQGSADLDLIITTHNYAEFLGDALDSIISQTRAIKKIIVVDDGSSDDPSAVVRRYDGVELLTLDNVGVAAARNAGLARATGKYVIFLDADDRLSPDAVERGLECMAANPGAGFIYGAHRLVAKDLSPLSGATLARVDAHAYADLLEENWVRMHGTVVYDRAKLLECGGFDETLPCCEDYDMYLRMAHRYRVACHSGVVADYRLHGTNMSSKAVEMLRWHVNVLERHRPADEGSAEFRSWQIGIRKSLKNFSNFVWKDREASFGRTWTQRLKMMRIAPRHALSAASRQLLARVLPLPVIGALRRVHERISAPRHGKIDFGDLARIRPISRDFGYRRGTPIDRYYIEGFLARHAADVTGHVLEFGDSTYSVRFGTGITRQDVANILPGSPDTTILGDISQPGVLGAEQFDCVIMTQVLPYFWEVRGALRHLRQALRPGGVVLATVPGISPILDVDWEWYWNFTVASARRLFAEEFGEDNVEVTVRGNAFAATCFLQGIAIEDVGASWLDPVDPAYPVNIAIRARR